MIAGEGRMLSRLSEYAVGASGHPSSFAGRETGNATLIGREGGRIPQP